MTVRYLSIVPFLSLLFLLTACAPQAALVKTNTEITGLQSDTKKATKNIKDIQKRLKALEADVKGTVNLQQTMADYNAQFDQFATDIKLLQGKLEENSFRLSGIAQKIDDQGFKIAELAARLEKLETAPGEQNRKQSQAKAPEPSEVYRQAKNDYDAANYNLAIAGFKNYIKQFPGASKTDNAWYWIGECYYSKKSYGKARDAFFVVLKEHPKSAKAPGARLKIGYSYLNEKNYARARNHLNAVIRDFPDSKEAQIAGEKLKKISKKSKKKSSKKKK